MRRWPRAGRASWAKSSVTLTLMPSPRSAAGMAGTRRASGGTLIITFSRATAFHSRTRLAIVRSVSLARSGDTSRLT